MIWQDISTAPKDGTPILAWGYLHDDGGPHYEDYRSLMGEMPNTLIVEWDEEKNLWINRMAGGSYDGLTHWMPLPPPPPKKAQSLRVDPDAPVTFRDLLPPWLRSKAIRLMTQEQFDTFPKADRGGFGPEGWERTGFVSPSKLLHPGGIRYRYWTLTEFVRRNERNIETTTSLVHVDGDVLIELDPEDY